MIVPARLRATCRNSPQGAEWLERLPGVVRELTGRWSLELAPPFDNDEVSCAWVAPVTRADGTPAVLKVGLPHFEADHEIDGLRFWNGDPTVRLLDADDAFGALLLERCEPGTLLRARPEADQDRIIAPLLRRLWRMPPSPHPFRPLAEQLALWGDEARSRACDWADTALVEDGLALFDELARSAPSHALLATDLHAGNVLSARREPWLVIDPKPFVGDPAYDATQHLLDRPGRLRHDPVGTIRRFADLLEVSHERVRLWTFARAAVASAAMADGASAIDLARALAP